MLLVAIVDEGVQSGGAFSDDTAATATITAIRPAPGHIGLTAETDATRSAITALDIDFCLIEEFHASFLFIMFNKKAQPYGCACVGLLTARL